MLFLLDEDLCDVNLCALHCELRNTEQLLSSLGMFAYECGSLKDCNAVLAEYGPDSVKGRDRVLVKAKPGQESGIERHNIQVVSFSGIHYITCILILDKNQILQCVIHIMISLLTLTEQSLQIFSKTTFIYLTWWF